MPRAMNCFRRRPTCSDVDDASALTIALEGQLMAGKLVEDKLAAAAPSEPVRLRDLLQGDDSVIQAVYLPRFFPRRDQRKPNAARNGKQRQPHHSRSSQTDWAKRFLAKLSERANLIRSPGSSSSAVRAALTSKVSVLTGGPGTGKTTTLKMLINALNDGDYRFNLASPTGRAAKRLGEAAGEDASTIHRLLGFSPDEGGFEHDESNPLKSDMVVIDEASMLDLQLFNSLLKALRADDPPSAGRRCRSAAIGRRRQRPARCHRQRRRSRYSPRSNLPPRRPEPHRQQRPPHQPGLASRYQQPIGRLFLLQRQRPRGGRRYDGRYRQAACA